MRSITYTIPGSPTPLARPRFGKNTVFDPQKPCKFSAGLYISRTHGNQPYFDGPVALDAIFYFPKPKSLPMAKLNSYHITRCDLDNCIKFICDICTGITYKDDCIVALIHAVKKYDKNPRTVFTLSEL